jgi:large subunit ribosomal protein L37Ae
MKVKKVGPAGSFGPRYGTVARRRYAEVVSNMRIPHECPRCHVRAVKRLTVGVWNCRKCGVKFAGGAYLPATKLGNISKRAAREGLAAGVLAAELKQRAEARANDEKAAAAAREKRGRRRKKVEQANEEPNEQPTEQ